MARLPRFVIPGHPQHVIVRGNNREAIFYENEDYTYYLNKLKDGCKKHDCELHAYVLMTNHVHLLLTPQVENGISKVIQMIGRYYVQYFNYKYRRTGTLWEGRYKASLIDSERYLLICYRYIELNPVRANMVVHPSDYPWSSYRSNALGEENKLITHHPKYLSLARTNEQRQSVYRGLFEQHIGDRTIEDIRAATNKAWVLGSEFFKAQIEQKTGRPSQARKVGGDRRSEEYRRSI